MKKGTCKMCLEYKDLCKESHIIPRFLYKFLSGKNNLLVFLDTKKHHFKYNSEYEGGILCEKCDTQTIGKLDDYASKFLHSEFPKKSESRFERIDNEDYLVRENDPNYDYRRFKLFLLSVLWRSSISSRPFFSKIKLQKESEEELRKMILDGDAGEPDKYPCFIHLPPLTTTPDGKQGFNTLHMLTIAPECVSLNGIEICKFVIEGSHYFFLTSKNQNMNVVPSVEKNKLSMRFSTLEEGQELQNQVIEIMKNHAR